MLHLNSFLKKIALLKLPKWLSGKASACQYRRRGFDPWVGMILWRRKWQPTLVFLPGKSHGQRSLVGYSPWGSKESHKTVTKTATSIVINEKFRNKFFLQEIT